MVENMKSLGPCQKAEEEPGLHHLTANQSHAAVHPLQLCSPQFPTPPIDRSSPRLAPPPQELKGVSGALTMLPSR